MRATSNWFLVLPAIATLLAASGAAAAQEAATVTASGKETIERAPTRLQLSIELIGRGKTLKEALAKLEQRKAAAGLLVKSLGADMETVEYGDPTTSNASSASREQLQAMIRERIGRGGGPTPEGLKLPESVTVSLPLSARWKLAEGDPTAMLEQATALRKKIDDADIGGLKEADDASLAEQELLEEAEAFGGYDPYSGEQQAKPGTPVFAYVATITPQERRAGLRAAFESAHGEAAELAAAAGMQLGGLANLEGDAIMAGSHAEEYYAYPAAYRRRMTPPPGDEKLASQSAELGKVPFTFVVQAKFHLQPLEK